MTEAKTTTSQPFFSGESFERMVGILIAVVTIIAAIAGYLQVQAGTNSNEALRQSQTYAIRAVGLKASGEVESSAWTDIIRLREELLSLAILAEDEDNPAAAANFRKIITRLEQLSPVLAAPYFDPATDEEPDLAAYEADSYLVESTTLSEQFINTFAVNEGWSNKANNYVTHITLLAVSLFLFGLSVTVAGRVRWLFVLMGLAFTILTVIWMLVVYLQPVNSLPDEAIAAYARGEGLFHQDKFTEAIAQFDQALALAPDYTSARVKRGETYFELDDNEQAAADFEAALAAGHSDLNTLINLGWIYYQQGRLAEAIQLSQLGLERQPDQSIHYFDLGVKQLVSGNEAAADAAYQTGIELAARQVAAARAAGQEPPDSLWFHLDTAVGDLESLYYCLTEELCTYTPPLEVIANPELVQAKTGTLKTQLKNLAVALEYTGQPPGAPVSAAIGPFEFAEPIYDEAGEWVDSNITATFTEPAEVAFFFDYEGMQKGQQVVWKVFYDGSEDPTLRLVEVWSLGPSGEAEFILSYGLLYNFNPGDFWVEMYVDSQLVQEGGFTVEAATE